EAPRRPRGPQGDPQRLRPLPAGRQVDPCQARPRGEGRDAARRPRAARRGPPARSPRRRARARRRPHRLGDAHRARQRLARPPVQFIDTAGASYDEELEEDTESRLNREEARLAAAKVRQLLDAGLTPSQVAVIAPYRAQVRLLRDLLADVPGLEIDNVDGFQG